MTKKQTEKLIAKQIREMMKDFTESLIQSSRSALRSGMIANDLYENLEAGGYLISKAIVDGVMRTRPYNIPKTHSARKNFDNVYYAV